MEKEEYMRLALIEAQKSLATDDVPVGAVIVLNGEVVGKAHNEREKNQHTVDHAEILAITMANEKLNCSRLDGAEVYVTKEPCLMCMGALLSARVSKIYFGAYDYRFGTMSLASDNNFNHKCEIEGGVLMSECESLIKEFFKKLR